jgi:predicted ester cyclase
METANIQLARRIVEDGFGGHNPLILDELASDNFIEHQRGMRDLEGTKAAIRDLGKAFPDLNYQLVNTIASGDLVCVQYRATGTHQGHLGPMPPSGKQFEIDLIDIMKFKDGKLIEHWGVPDRLGLMEDLGFWPPKHQEP